MAPLGSLSESLEYFTLRYGRTDEQEKTIINTTLPELNLGELEEYTEYVFEVRSVFTDGILSSFVNTSVVTLQDGEQLDTSFTHKYYELCIE